MKKTVANTLAVILLTVSTLILLFQGFAFPAIGAPAGAILRLIAAFCTQAIFLMNIRKPFLRFLPLILFAAVALWGGWLFLTSEHWKNVSFTKYAADYCTPLLAGTMCLLVKKGSVKSYAQI